jgi:hypothetical protein
VAVEGARESGKPSPSRVSPHVRCLIKGETSVKVTNFPLFPFLDGKSSLKDPGSTPLACLLKHWKDLDPESLQQKWLKFYCTEAWQQYPLGDEKRWPEGGSINYNTILQLDIFW